MKIFFIETALEALEKGKKIIFKKPLKRKEDNDKESMHVTSKKSKNKIYKETNMTNDKKNKRSESTKNNKSLLSFDADE